MNLLAMSSTEAGPAEMQLSIGCLLGVLACYFLLPRPRGRSVALGLFSAIAAGTVLTLWIIGRFGEPAPDLIGTILFWLFSSVAVLFAFLFVISRNPARGAIAFAFVIISTCGLFLLLAAPFLMAATIIIYAGAIIVTFLFVLMLSQTDGQSNENDRTREPFLGSLGGFGFLGLVLLSLFLSSPATVDPGLPQPLSPAERTNLYAMADKLAAASRGGPDELRKASELRTAISDVVGGPGPAGQGQPRGSLTIRFDALLDPRATSTKNQAEIVRKQAVTVFNAIENNVINKPNPAAGDIAKIQTQLGALRDQILLLAGQGELPARNVSNIGLAIYTDHLLAVEMAGTILLIATIGAVIIAGRKGTAS